MIKDFIIFLTYNPSNIPAWEIIRTALFLYIILFISIYILIILDRDKITLRGIIFSAITALYLLISLFWGLFTTNKIFPIQIMPLYPLILLDIIKNVLKYIKIKNNKTHGA